MSTCGLLRARVELLLISSLAICALSTPARAQLYFNSDADTQLYRLDTTTGAATPVATTGTTKFTCGLTETNDPNILLGSTPFSLTRIDLTTGTHTVVGPLNGGNGVEGMGFDPTTNRLYGTLNGSFFRVDPATGENLGTLAEPSGDFEGLAYAAGRMYGLAGFSGPRGRLSYYDFLTDAWTIVGDTGILFNECALAYDPVADRMYALGLQNGNLYTINRATARCTLIGPTGLGPIGGGLAFVPIPEARTAGALLLASLIIIVARERRDGTNPNGPCALTGALGAKRCTRAAISKRALRPDDQRAC